MKRLTILCSLALLALPDFGGGTLSFSVDKNQGKVIEGETTETSATRYTNKTATISFGEGTSDGSSLDSSKGLSSYADIEGIDIDSFSCTNCSGVLKSNGTNALKMSSSSKIGTITFTFKTEIILEKVILNAAQYKNDYGNYTVESSNGAKATNEIKGSSFTEYTFDSLDGGNKQTSKTITISAAAAKRIFISKIEFSILVPNASTTATVTYDYGTAPKKDTWKDNETVDIGASVTEDPLSSKEDQEYSDWSGSYMFYGWYDDNGNEIKDITNNPVDDDVTYHARWESLEDSADVTNVKSSKTMSQLYYEYDTESYKTGTISFGENKNANSSELSTNNALSKYANIEGIDIASFTESKCYSTLIGSSSSKPTDALKICSSKVAGNITLNFESPIVLKKVILYASQYNVSEKGSYTVTSSNETKVTKEINQGTSYNKYIYEGLDGEDKKTSSSITIAADSVERIYVSKIEFIIHQEPDTSVTPYNISNIGLRFGGVIKKDYYDAVVEHVTSYGIKYATSLPAGYESVAKAIEANAFDAGALKTKSNNIEEVALKTTAEIDGEECYIFNIYFNINSASVTQTVYAIANITFDNGLTVYFAEKVHSVMSIASEYLKTGEYDGAIKDTLEILASGKTNNQED